MVFLQQGYGETWMNMIDLDVGDGSNPFVRHGDCQAFFGLRDFGHLWTQHFRNSLAFYIVRKHAMLQKKEGILKYCIYYIYQCILQCIQPYFSLESLNISITSPVFWATPSSWFYWNLGLLGQPGTANSFLHQIITRLRRVWAVGLSKFFSSFSSWELH